MLALIPWVYQNLRQFTEEEKNVKPRGMIT